MMRALTVKRPWSAAIAGGLKVIENRTWRPRAGIAEFAVHAGAGWDNFATGNCAMSEAMHDDTHPGPARYQWGVTSAIVAVATLTADPHLDGACPSGVGCEAWGVPSGHRPMWHWPITAQALAEPVPIKGRLGLWTLPDDVEAAVRAQLAPVGAR